MQVGVCVQRRFKSVSTSRQFDDSPGFSLEERLDPWLPIECPSKLNKILSVKLLIFSFLSVLTYFLGAQKNHLMETVLLSSHNICFG